MIQLGDFVDKLYIRGKLLGVVFFILGLIFILVSLFAKVDALGTNMALFGGLFFFMLSLFQLVFRNDGLYIYENGLEIVRFSIKKSILFAEIRNFTIISNWALSSINSFFISFNKTPHIVIRLYNGKMCKLFFEADEYTANVLTRYIPYARYPKK